MHPPYHYDISGLSNVYLTGGVTRHQTPYGEGIAITAIDALHAVLAGDLMALDRPLSGEEHRFLRTHLDLAPDDAAFAARGITAEAVTHHEQRRGSPVPLALDSVVREIALLARPTLAATVIRDRAIGRPVHARWADGRWTL
jgi:putative transcriptional regulator